MYVFSFFKGRAQMPEVHKPYSVSNCVVNASIRPFLEDISDFVVVCTVTTPDLKLTRYLSDVSISNPRAFTFDRNAVSCCSETGTFPGVNVSMCARAVG